MLIKRSESLNPRPSVWRKLLVCFGVVLCTGLQAWPDEGPSIKWREKTFSYVADNQDLAEVLGVLGAAQGLSVVVSPEVHGTVSGNFTNVSPEQFLNTLSVAHNFVWYCDGAALYVCASHEVDSIFISLDYLKPDDALEMLKKLGVYDPRFTLRSVSDPPMIHVVGPPQYLENLSNVILTADVELSRREVRQEEVRMFALKHAWAGDISLPLREGETSVPGVATTLRKLMTENDESYNRPREIASQAQSQSGGAGSGGMSAPGRPVDVENSRIEAVEPQPVTPATPSEAAEPYEYGSPTHMASQLDPDIRPSIEADTRRNAVIIRDSAARMKLYEDLIHQLDVPVRLVEIQASILDVDAELAFEWGLESSLTYNDHHNDGTVGVSTIPEALAEGVVGNVGSADASWLLISDHLKFLSSIRALEGKGQARILSRPSLVTFANLEAELRDDQTFNARVSGERVAELVSVTAGVQLRVTANVIDPPEGQEAAPPGIQLLVHIEDGSFENTSIDGLPVVRTSALNTQAVVGHGKSLLVGGYLKDTRETNDRGVPVLSKVPMVGNLFKSTSRNHQVMQRMFLLTPRIVELDAAMGLDPLDRAKRLEAEKNLFSIMEQQVKGTTAKSLHSDDTPRKKHGKKAESVEEKGQEEAPALKELPSVDAAPVETTAPDSPVPAEAPDSQRNYSFKKSTQQP